MEKRNLEHTVEYQKQARSSTHGFDVEVFEGRPTAQHLINERRRSALAEIDNAPFSVCLVAGVGFFTDAYDIFAISIASIMLGYVYGGDTLVLNKQQDLGVKIATPVGTVVGQLLFGWLADVVGRKKMYGIELMIIITSTFAQALAANSHAVHIIGVLVVWCFILGIGIGGDYPLSAVMSSEFAATRIRGRMMTTVVSGQGFGNFTAALVGLIVVSVYKGSILNSESTNAQGLDLESVDFMWRILIGFGCVPGAIALYFRLTIPETPRFTMDIERNIDKATQDITNITNGQKNVDEDAFIQRIDTPKASWADFRAHFGQWKNFKMLFGTAYSWFAVDIAFYGLNLNTGTILTAIGFGSLSPKTASAAYSSLHNVCVGNLILSAAGLIPGCWATFLLIDKWGRKPIQLMGFIVLTALFIILGFSYEKLAKPGSSEIGPPQKVYFFLYCLANFFQNFGPNVTVFIVPGEAFPTRYRSTAHGISAASGKLGAVVAQAGFSQLKDIGGPNKWVGHILEIFAFFMLTGVGSTLLLPETKGLTLEQLSNEDQERFVRGVKNPMVDNLAPLIIQA
ncbi:hypothetical protein D9619_011200 [Psilocybe cf. subviscida]|uniref:Major facilitator superfamily (MFS) profile domain-containing protein n=1 Tax=Psilocybe cf. subviscida TaxID=2480587 RepID=A0A8H5BJ59_9AGAR|nr:hypothetical protein D9619_011200 [Psilocybe cf. subviscida]